MNRILLSLVATCLLRPLYAQVARDSIEVNNVRTFLSALGGIDRGAESSTRQYRVPATGNASTMYAYNLWIAGVDAGSNLHVVAQTFGLENEWYCGPLNDQGQTDQSTMEAFNRVWHCRKSDIDAHQLYFELMSNGGNVAESFPDGYTIPEWIMTWPAHGDVLSGYSFNLSPFYDYNSDGLYSPEQGDFPKFCGDEALYVIFNDNGGLHMGSGGLPLNVEVHLLFYGYNDLTGMPDKTLFMHYDIYERGWSQYSETYIGFWTDFDIGTNYDDYVMTDVSRNAIIGFNGDDFDEDSYTYGYGSDLPAQAVMLLGGPKADADSTDNPIWIGGTSIDSLGGYGHGYGDGIVDNEQCGLSYSQYYNIGAHPVTGDPMTSNDYFNYLRGHWKNGDYLTFGGNGAGSSTGATDTVCHFMYPGNSDPEFFGTGGIEMPLWTESTGSNPVGDRRMIGSSGPFTLSANAHHVIDVAFITAFQSESVLNDEFDALNSKMDAVRIWYDSQSADCINNAMSNSLGQLETARIGLFPNPNNGEFQVSTPLTSGSMDLKVYDVAGRLVLSERIQAGVTTIRAEQLPAGLYTVNALSYSQSFTTKVIIH